MGDQRRTETKRPVAILGATGAVGQRFVQQLAGHPWFEIVAVMASSRSAGRTYEDACRWMLPEPMPDVVKRLRILPLDPGVLPRDPMWIPIVFSALPADVAREVEPTYAADGCAVFSNASAFRHETDVPLLVPEVNLEHVGLLEAQSANRGWPGFIVTNPNCTTTGIAMVLKPLDAAFGLRKVSATTLQAISGAGYPGIPSLDVMENVIPFIATEEEKIARETRRLLGRLDTGRVSEAAVIVSAQANRVPVIDGHTVCLSLGFERTPSAEEAMDVLATFRGPEPVRALPSAPSHPVVVLAEKDRPQPRKDRNRGAGMAVSVGRIRTCPLLDLRMVLVVHNTIRGAAGGSVLNAEALLVRGALG